MLFYIVMLTLKPTNLRPMFQNLTHLRILALPINAPKLQICQRINSLVRADTHDAVLPFHDFMQYPGRSLQQ